MSLETEVVLDRRRLRRRTSFWRAIALLLAIALIGAFSAFSDKTGQLLGLKQIARVSITGAITENRDQLKMLNEIANADHVEAVVVYVNSPGGTTTGGEALYESLRKIAKKKPVVGQFGTVAASAGYIVGLATDHIVARGNTITGSVGVIVQWPEVTGLLEKIGIKMNEIKSGKLKATPSPFQELDDQGRQITKIMVNESFDWFLSLVEQRRKISSYSVPGLREGRIYSGREAVKLKLVDEIGGEAEAIAWLEKERGVQTGLDVIDWKPTIEESWGFSATLTRLASAIFGVGAEPLGYLLARDPNLSTLGLDGLVSVWHPSKN